MKTAVVLGATGMIGRALVQHLCANGVNVIAVGRREMTLRDATMFFESEVVYIRCPLDRIRSLPSSVLERAGHLPKGSVFYNLAWQGFVRLTEGTLEEQILNVKYCSDAVMAAKELGCRLYISTGTQEEARAEIGVRDPSSMPSFHQFEYTVSKIASRDMCKIVSYLAKIDCIHTRLSIVLPRRLIGEGYVTKTIKNIIAGRPYDSPANNSLVDIALLEDVVNAYFLIGLNGKHLEEYYVGTGSLITLADYFAHIESITKGADYRSEWLASSSTDPWFCVKRLSEHTNYAAKLSRYDCIEGKVS